MPDDSPFRRVEVRFAGTPPALQVARAAGVSNVEAGRFTLRCVVYGSFQPFLEALRGHEVLALTSIPVLNASPPPAPDRGSRQDREASHGS